MDNQVKQRVIGAVVLVALAVIFVPMLLEKPDSDLDPVGSNLPEQPDMAVQDRIEPLTLPEPPPENEPAQVVLDQAPDMTAAPAAGDAGMPPAEGAAPATTAPAPAAEAPAAVAQALPAPVTAAPPAAPAQPPATTPAQAVPPAAAPPAAAPAPVTPAAPAPSAQTETAAKPLSGWVVQLASLASKNNALALRERLRGLGYTAFVEEIKTAQGVLYRVRVGPELERVSADNLRNRLEQQVQIKGIVTRYP